MGVEEGAEAVLEVAGGLVDPAQLAEGGFRAAEEGEAIVCGGFDGLPDDEEPLAGAVGGEDLMTGGGLDDSGKGEGPFAEILGEEEMNEVCVARLAGLGRRGGKWAGCLIAPFAQAELKGQQSDEKEGSGDDEEEAQAQGHGRRMR